MNRISDLLVSGGDERIRPNPTTGLNRYGCAPSPDAALAAFGSSTASVISASAHRALLKFARDLDAYDTPTEAYAIETRRVREDLAQLCGLDADNIVLAPSGTDLHLISADLARGGGDRLLTVLAEAAETGRGVPDAVRFTRFGAASPHGETGACGEPLSGSAAGRLATVPLRQAEGAPREAAEVDADFERLCRQSLESGARVLLVLVDVSKTGLVAPSQACARALKRRFGEALTVLVDACQFRLSPATIASYLADDFLVGVTGSKFIGGPAFCGALIVPEASAARLRVQPLLPALGDYSSRHDWPSAYLGRDALPDVANLGLLLRWRAALHELVAFQALPPTQVAGFLARFAGRIETWLDANAGFERIAPPALRRGDPQGWDASPTIFPFLVLRDGAPLGPQAVQVLHQGLRGQGVELGQPVRIGERNGEELTVLRLCASARLVVEALGEPGGEARVIARATAALEATVALAKGL